VDVNEYWIENTRRKMPQELLEIVEFSHSSAHCHTIGGQGSSQYDNLPSVSPNFLYVDGPSGFDDQGSINGLTGVIGDVSRRAVAADPLLYESTSAKKGFFIVVDGKASCVAFLQVSLKRRYRFFNLRH